ncbi:MAG: right-handed parallel beta-helix repeat-containing protein [Clostridia bacterium]|nr:right-handed parallel beta-helix repeat-containing protein [Clostridia bacterium]
MKKQKLLFCILLSLLLLSLPVVTAFGEPAPEKDAANGETVIYVAPDGDDAAAGTAAAPLATPAGALKAARKRTGDGSVAVEFADGTYTLKETLSFGESDGDVVFRAAKNAEVRFSGAEEIGDFIEETVNGVKVFTRTFANNDPVVNIRSLFSADARLSLPRYPETGFLKVKDLCPEDDLFTEETTFWDLSLGQVSFIANKKDIDKNVFANGDPTIRILHFWHDEMMTAQYDDSAGKVTLSRPSTMKIYPEDRYYFENVFSALDAPGEWYMDQNAAKLYYVPREGEKADTLRLYAPLTEQLVLIDGADNVRFENIIFTCTDWEPAVAPEDSNYGKYGMDSSQAANNTDGALRIENAENVVFTGCEFRHLGAWAVKFYDNVRSSRVENCLLDDIAAGGVFVGGANVPAGEEGHTEAVTVTNNVIRSYGRVFQNAVGLQITYASDCVFSHNEISDGFYTAISVGWDWGYTSRASHHNKISDNLIYDIGQGQLSDMGGIYMLGKQPGTVLSGNVIHTVTCDPEGGGYGGWGIYLDEGSSDMTVENNLCFCCKSQGLNIHYGEGNVFRNNISAFNADGAVSAGSRDEPHATAFYYNNIFLTRDGAPIYSYMTSTGHFYDNGNLMWDATKGGKLSFCTGDADGQSYPAAIAKALGYLHNDAVADPGFTDAENFDFSLKEDSPAFDLYFRAWDYQNAGTLPGTIVGLAYEGGKTAYNAGAEMPAKFTRAKSVVTMLAVYIAAVLLSLALLAILITGAKKAGLSLPIRIMPVLFLLAGVPMVFYFIRWNPVVYSVCMVLCYAFAALPPAIAFSREFAGKKRILTCVIPPAAAAALHTGLILILNNALRIGEPRAISVTLCVTLALLIAYAIVLFKKTRYSAPESRK